jgi:predicted NAD/FAD-dependent oxidoreductase
MTTPVDSFEVNESSGRITSLQLKDGQRLVFDQVVLAVPWTAAAKFLPVSDRSQQLASSLLNGPILGIHLWTDRPLAPDLITGFLDSPLHWLFDRTSTLPAERSGHLYAAVISAISDRIDQSGKELVELVLSEIHRLIPSSQGVKVTHHVVYKSRDATFSGPTGKPLARPGPITSIDNLFLAGDWTDTNLPATIEGAAVSGFRAAEAVG